MKKETSEDRLDLKDEFAVNVKKKATSVNAPRIYKRRPTKPQQIVVIGKLTPNEEFIMHEPGTKTVYAFDKDFNFISEAIAFECPMEKGTFHIPRNCTEVKPNEKFKFQRFDPKKQTWNEVTAEVLEKEKTPELTKEQKAEKIRFLRTSLLASSDYTQIGDAIEPSKTEAWQAYRKKLRDITKQPGFPDLVSWPEKPV